MRLSPFPLQRRRQRVDRLAPVYSFSHLRLARVLVLQNKPDPARDEYHAFFAAWKSADTDLPLPVQSHAPLQRAKSGGISHGRVHRMNRQIQGLEFVPVRRPARAYAIASKTWDCGKRCLSCRRIGKASSGWPSSMSVSPIMHWTFTSQDAVPEPATAGLFALGLAAVGAGAAAGYPGFIAEATRCIGSGCAYEVARRRRRCPPSGGTRRPTPACPSTHAPAPARPR